MRRAALLSAVLGLAAAGLGCHHVAGKCDCTYDPADFPLPVPTQPYAAVGGPVGGAPAAVTPAPAPGTMVPLPKDKVPPATDGK